MIRKCIDSDRGIIHEIINDSASAYRGIIPDDCWHEPYMPMDELQEQVAGGVDFYGYEENGTLIGVMGIQDRGDVALIRHAYVRSKSRNMGIGKKLLDHLQGLTEKPILIGTWAAAAWAVAFYRKNGFREVSEEMKDFLLKKYWSIPERQVETSVVLADSKFDVNAQ